MLQSNKLFTYLLDQTIEDHTWDHHGELLVFYLLSESGQEFEWKVKDLHEHKISENNVLKVNIIKDLHEHTKFNHTSAAIEWSSEIH